MNKIQTLELDVSELENLESKLSALFPPVELDEETRQRILDKVKVYVPLA